MNLEYSRLDIHVFTENLKQSCTIFPKVLNIYQCKHFTYMETTSLNGLKLYIFVMQGYESVNLVFFLSTFGNETWV